MAKINAYAQFVRARMAEIKPKSRAAAAAAMKRIGQLWRSGKRNVRFKTVKKSGSKPSKAHSRGGGGHTAHKKRSMFYRAGGVLGICAHLNTVARTGAITNAGYALNGQKTPEKAFSDTTANAYYERRSIGIGYGLWLVAYWARKYFGVPIPAAIASRMG